MKELINHYFNLISRTGIILVLLSALFLFSNLTTEFYDTPKFLVLFLITGILLILTTLRFALNNRVVIIRTPLDVPLILLLTVAVVSTVTSASPYVALLGNQLKVYGSLIGTAALVFFYFMLVNSIRQGKELKLILFISTISGAVLSVVSLLAYSGMKLLPAPWSHGLNFSPTGSSFTTTAILAMLIPLVLSKILSGKNLLFLVLNSSFLALFGVTIALTGNLSTWIPALAGLLLVLAKNRVWDRLGNIRPINLISLIGSLAVTVLITVLSFIPPVGDTQNPLYNQSKAFPREISAPFVSSWKVAVSAFRDSPFWGTGPSTYLFDFTNYKPIEVNSTKIWNVRFDSSFNEYFQILATLGGVGLVALLSLTALFVTSAYPALTTRHSGLDPESINSDKTALAVSGLLFFVILAIHPGTLVFWIFGLLIIACFYLTNLSANTPQTAWRSWGKVVANLSSFNPQEETIRIEALPSILLTIVLGVVGFTFFFGAKFALADYHHRLALNAASANQVVPAYNELVIAEKLNPQSDLYRTDLAQINFALANAIAQSKGPTEASPSGSLTDTDKQNIQTLLQQSITEGRSATSLSPRSSLNWEVLALLYRQIAGVAQNALVFSLDSYGKAIFQDPLNPNLRLSVGGVYYAIQNYDLAIRFFTDAINLKPDFANGYYNLSVAMRDKGDLTTAQAAAEKVLTLVEKDSQDYKVANDYLTDLKNRIASGSAKESAIKPPASQTQGSLQQKELPKVVNVGTPPEKIATPSAVKKPNATPEPTPIP